MKTLVRFRFIMLVLAAVAAFVAGLGISLPRERVTRQLMLVVDVTGSMNARDYLIDGVPVSRLDKVRDMLPSVLGRMPCGSSVGISIFTERRSFILLMPVEVCENYAALASAVEGLNWRMAWEGDSHIASGLQSALLAAANQGYDVVFLTDGQEAPPLSWAGGPRFEGKVGAVLGLIVGVGGTTPVPIPKFDDHGREAGFYNAEDVPQESRTGPPPPDAEMRPGYNPRNNPYGDMPAGTEHLTSLREAYLGQLSRQLGLGYARLETADGLHRAIEASTRPHSVLSAADLSPLFGALSLAAALAAFLSRKVRSPFPMLMKERIVFRSLVLAALASTALIASQRAEAHGPTPQKVDETIEIQAPCELVWSTLLDFGSIGKWHPGIASVQATGASARGTKRTLTFANGESVVEKLDDIDSPGQSLSYRLSQENLKALPVSFYTAKLTASRPATGQSCNVQWEGRFYRGDTTNEPAPELSDEAAVTAMTEFFKVGLKGLKEKME